jgi:hypothetical protein
MPQSPSLSEGCYKLYTYGINGKEKLLKQGNYIELKKYIHLH